MTVQWTVIPTGVLADTRGRRASFLLSVSILLVTTLAYIAAAEFGGGLIAFALVSVLMGLGFTFYSGAVTVGGGLLGGIGLALPYVVRAGMMVLVLGVAFFCVNDVGFTPRTVGLAQLRGEMQRVARASIAYGWTTSLPLTFAFWSSANGSHNAWGSYAIPCEHRIPIAGINATWSWGSPRVSSSRLQPSPITALPITSVGGPVEEVYRCAP